MSAKDVYVCNVDPNYQSGSDPAQFNQGLNEDPLPVYLNWDESGDQSTGATPTENEQDCDLPLLPTEWNGGYYDAED